jgi:biopolymer transport protein ExbD
MKKNLLIIVIGLVIVLAALAGAFFFTARTEAPAEAQIFSKQTPPTNGEVPVTLLLLDNNNLFYYHQDKVKEGRKISYSQLREVLQSVKKSYPADAFYVDIRPGKKIAYKTTVDVLDEMTINDIKKYIINKPSSQDQELIASLR